MARLLQELAFRAIEYNDAEMYYKLIDDDKYSPTLNDVCHVLNFICNRRNVSFNNVKIFEQIMHNLPFKPSIEYIMEHLNIAILIGPDKLNTVYNVKEFVTSFINKLLQLLNYMCVHVIFQDLYIYLSDTYGFI